MKLIKAIKRFWRHYVLGYYHCDKCPYCWEEHYYEGDCDCGCYIYGDIRDTCRLLPPLRHIIGSIRKKVYTYHENHAYDGFAEFVEKDDELQRKFNELFCEALNRHSVGYKNGNGEWTEFTPDAFHMLDALHRFRHEYEDFAHPFEVKTYRQEFKEFLSKIWKSFIGKFKPYFCE